MEEKTSGIVLGGVCVGESDKILNVFTLEKGVVSAKIKGVKKAGARLKFAAEPFCFAEFIFSRSADRRTVIGASLIDSFYPLRENIKKYFAAGTVLEFIKRFYRESMVSPDDFFLTVETLKNIAYGDNPISALVIFLLNALKLSGFQLTPDFCLKCGEKICGRVFFDYRIGGFLCEECFDGTGREINPVTLSALINAEKGILCDSDDGTLKAVKLLDYYIENRAEERISSLKELIKLCD